MSEYPTRGFNLITPTIAERQLTGHVATVQFERLGHRYAIKWIVGRAVECSRNGKSVAWHKMNTKAQAVAHKAYDFLKGALTVMKAR
jgi:hypothetical protein